MDEFVGKMDAIVVAEVTSVIGSDERNSYNEQDNIRNIKEGDLVAGDSITLRVLGEADHVSPYPSLIPMPQVNDRRLYGLSRNPDGTYGTYGWWSVFLIDGDRVTHADDLRQKVMFANSTEPDDFVRELESAVTVGSR